MKPSTTFNLNNISTPEKVVDIDRYLQPKTNHFEFNQISMSILYLIMKTNPKKFSTTYKNSNPINTELYLKAAIKELSKLKLYTSEPEESIERALKFQLNKPSYREDLLDYFLEYLDLKKGSINLMRYGILKDVYEKIMFSVTDTAKKLFNFPEAASLTTVDKLYDYEQPNNLILHLTSSATYLENLLIKTTNGINTFKPIYIDLTKDKKTLIDTLFNVIIMESIDEFNKELPSSHNRRLIITSKTGFYNVYKKKYDNIYYNKDFYYELSQLMNSNLALQTMGIIPKTESGFINELITNTIDKPLTNLEFDLYYNNKPLEIKYSKTLFQRIARAANKNFICLIYADKGEVSILQQTVNASKEERELFELNFSTMSKLKFSTAEFLEYLDAQLYEDYPELDEFYITNFHDDFKNKIPKIKDFLLKNPDLFYSRKGIKKDPINLEKINREKFDEEQQTPKKSGTMWEISTVEKQQTNRNEESDLEMNKKIEIVEVTDEILEEHLNPKQKDLEDFDIFEEFFNSLSSPPNQELAEEYKEENTKEEKEDEFGETEEEEVNEDDIASVIANSFRNLSKEKEILNKDNEIKFGK